RRIVLAKNLSTPLQFSTKKIGVDKDE
ncbi:MAG: hypothetical protein RIR75_530, partial [Actinomycetota bacterium]